MADFSCNNSEDHQKSEIIDRVAVFGFADAPPGSELYKDAFETSKVLAQSGYLVVNGGGPGVMRAATEGAHAGGGKVTGVTFYPKEMIRYEGKDPLNQVDEEVITQNYVERTLRLLERGQVYVIFNGGTGTVSEFGMAWGLARLYFGHHKPMILYGNFWREIIEAFKRNMHLREGDLTVFKIAQSAHEVLKSITDFGKEISEGKHVHLKVNNNGKGKKRLQFNMLSDKELKKLEERANLIRQDIIKMLLEAGSGHSAGPLGMADIFTALYFNILNHDPKKPDWVDRDRLILSNGHICPVRYTTMAHAGYFPVSELMTLRKLGTRLQGHPHRTSLPGIETTSGPLGSGLSQSIGLALVGRIDKAKWRVYCLMSDGEQDEGNTWEAVMLAAKYKLHNLTALIDRNNIQIDGFTEDVMPLDDLRDKYEAFGWHVLEIDGHNFEQIISSFNEAKTIFEKPTVIIAHTIPGKGVDFMENRFEWHGKSPNQEEAKLALDQLRTLQGKIRSEHQ